MSKKTRVRIAPSPTGEPHIGTAYTALFNYAFAKKNQGEFIIRIEDTDQTRLVAGAEEQIYQALDWLGLTADEGPKQGGKFAPYKQSERFSIYKKFARQLVEKDWAYHCDCFPERLQKIREDQQAHGQVPHYDGKCRENPPAEIAKAVVRLKVPKEGETSFEDTIRGKITFKNSDIDDQVLLKSDGFPTYHLASVVDDHSMEISDVIRGEDWLSSTPKHVLLYQAFGWELPVFAHLPLLRNPDKSKLSKRKNPVSILFYRDEGYLPEALRNFLALMGWSMPDGKEIFDLDEFIGKIDLKRVDPAGPVFDIQKLEWLNGQYIRDMGEDELAKRLVGGNFTKYSEEQVKSKLFLVKERLKKLKDFDELTKYFFESVSVDPQFLSRTSGIDYKGTADWLRSANQVSSGTQAWNANTIEEGLNKKVEELGINKTRFFQTIRGSVSGSVATPPLGQTVEAIGQEEFEKRNEENIKKLDKAAKTR